MHHIWEQVAVEYICKPVGMMIDKVERQLLGLQIFQLVYQLVMFMIELKLQPNLVTHGVK